MANETDKEISVFLENELGIDYLVKEAKERREVRRLLQKTLYYANCVFLKRYDAPLISCLPVAKPDGPVFLDLHYFLETPAHHELGFEQLDEITCASLSAIAEYCKKIGHERLIAQTHLSSLWETKTEGDQYAWDEIIEQFPSTEFEREMYDTLLGAIKEKVQERCYTTDWKKEKGSLTPWPELVFTQ